MFFFFQGCLTQVEEFFQQHFTILAIVGIGVACIQVSHIKLFCCLTVITSFHREVIEFQNRNLSSYKAVFFTCFHYCLCKFSP